MANRIPLIVNPTAGQIQELPSGDTLLIGNDVDVNGSVDISTNLTLSNNTNSSTRLIVSSTTASTNSTSGSATFAGGVGISGALYVGSTINGTLANDIVTTDSINNDAVTYAKIQNVSATNRILGRDSDGAGVIEEISPANLRTMINVADGATNVTNNNQLTNGAGYITSAITGIVKSSFINNYTETTYNSTTNAGAYNNFLDHLSISLTPSNSNNRVVVMASFQICRTNTQNNGWYAKARITGGGDLQPQKVVSTNSISYSEDNKFSVIAYDAAGNTSARTYKLQVQYTSTSASYTGMKIKSAAIWAVELKA